MDEAGYQKMLSASNREIGQYLNDQLYRMDKRGIKGGVKKTVDEEVQALGLTRDEHTVLAPLLDKIVERNVELWQDVHHMYMGNADRSTIERVMNSYWLYWPLSYQVKATKWLADIMLNGSFGHDNGALLAGKYALWQQQHEDRMKNDARYAAMFKQNPTMWFMAQMLLPITPDSIGVSLSRATRFAARSTQELANSWLGTRIGLFTAYKQEDQGLIPALTWIADMGPLYTADLINRMSAEPAFESLPLVGKPNKTSAAPNATPFRSVPPTLPLQVSPVAQ